MNIKFEANKQKEKLIMANEKITAVLERAPEGNIWVNDSAGHFCIKNPNCEARYLKIEDSAIIEKHEKKKYYKRLKKALEKEIKALGQFDKNYNPDGKYEVYEKMPNCLKPFINPAFESVKEKVKKWQAEAYELNPSYRENCLYESARGEKMRSKSEVIIANQLDKCPYLDYRYEKPLWLPGMNRPIYPDFTIINLITGRIYYWEHCGMLDKKQYAEDFIWKYNIYVKNGITPKVNLILTFESEGRGLDMAVIKKQISDMREDA